MMAWAYVAERHFLFIVNSDICSFILSVLLIWLSFLYFYKFIFLQNTIFSSVKHVY